MTLLKDVRWIAAWTHQGDHSLVHAIPDNPEGRSKIALGNMGMYAVTACKIGRMGRSSSFMRLFEGPDDGPVVRDADGWIIDYAVAGRDFDPEDLPNSHQRVCTRCASRVRNLTTQKENS
jgi:hypothetical protein